MKAFVYRAYNLVIHSDIECPELPVVTDRDGCVPDVVVRYGESPTCLPGSRAPYDNCFIVPDECLCVLDDGPRLWVRNGNEIIVTNPSHSLPADFSSWLLGVCFSVLLYQRGALLLHASAIETRRGVVAFAAPSGTGKSTLAAAFYDRGYRVVADDVCAVRLDDHQRPLVAPSYPRLKLRPDMVLHSGRDPRHLPRVESPEEQKYAVPAHRRFATKANVLDSVYALQVCEREPLTLQPCAGAERLAVLLENTYRPIEMRALGLAQHHFKLTAEIAQRIRVCRVTRPAAPFLLDELIARLESDFAGEAS